MSVNSSYGTATGLASRRDVLGGLLVAGTTACAGSRILPAATSRPLGLASLTVAHELAADYPGTLRQVKALGYTHFGFALAAMSPRQPVPRNPLEVAAMVRDAGLEVGAVRLGHADNPYRQMQLAAQTGARVVVQSASPVFFTGSAPGRARRAEFDAWLPRLALLSEAARSEGLQLAYHNHDWDHVPLEGLTPLDLIARRFSPEEVGFEIDLAWARLAGVDPLAIVRELEPRVLSLHFKDVDPARGRDQHSQLVAPGEGDIGFADLVPALDRLTDAIGYVEIDDPEDGLQAARVGARTIRKARGLI